MPSAVAVLFISVTNDETEPASQRARIFATLSAEASSSASRASRSLSCSPALTSTTDWCSLTSPAYAAASAAVTVMVGPDSPSASGWCLRMRYAVIVLATLAIGSATSVLPEVPSIPTPSTSIAACPAVGQGSFGDAPGMVKLSAICCTSFAAAVSVPDVAVAVGLAEPAVAEPGPVAPPFVAAEPRLPPAPPPKAVPGALITAHPAMSTHSTMMSVMTRMPSRRSRSGSRASGSGTGGAGGSASSAAAALSSAAAAVELSIRAGPPQCKFGSGLSTLDADVQSLVARPGHPPATRPPSPWRARRAASRARSSSWTGRCSRRHGSRRSRDRTNRRQPVT